MSRITQKSAVAPLNPWSNISTGVPNQAYSANPANQAITTTGTGFADPNMMSYVGQKFDTSDGRELALVQNGAVALVAGVLLQSEAEVTAFQKLAMTVPTATPATAGLTQILVTNGSTVLNINKYQGGYLIVASGTGIGQMFKIASHQPAANAATFIVNLEDPIQTTLDATSKVSLLQNPYANVVISPITTATGGPIGVTIYNIAASTAPTYNGTTGALTANGVAQYGLVTTHGPCTCLIDNTVTNVGYPLGVSKTTAGTLGVATLTTVPQIAVSSQTLTSANNGLVYLQL
jgi:hypothetical protein